MRAEIDKRGHAVKDMAEAIAPFDAGHDGDHYKDHFSVARHSRADRAASRISNNDPASLEIEAGTKDTPAHHTLIHALDAART
jgi:hypothetical protein